MRNLKIEMNKDGFNYRIKERLAHCYVENGTLDYSVVDDVNREFDRSLSTILTVNAVTYVIAWFLACFTFVINIVLSLLDKELLSFPQLLLISVSIVALFWMLSFIRFTKTEYTWDGFVYEIIKKRNGVLSVLASSSRIKLYCGQTIENCPKKNAGARQSVESKSARMFYGKTPKYLKIKGGLKIFQIKFRGQRIFFMPDRVLILNDRKFHSEFYKDIRVQIKTLNYIERESVPDDAQVVKYTWQYVNLDGSPDKRFNNNYRIPVCNYAELSFYGKNGFMFCIIVSSYKRAYYFANQWNAIERFL